MTDRISKLPTGLLREIASFSPFQDLETLSAVNERFSDVASSESLWIEVALRDVGPEKREELKEKGKKIISKRAARKLLRSAFFQCLECEKLLRDDLYGTAQRRVRPLSPRMCYVHGGPRDSEYACCYDADSDFDSRAYCVKCAVAKGMNPNGLPWEKSDSDEEPFNPAKKIKKTPRQSKYMFF